MEQADKNYTTFYIARHGETEANTKKLYQGHFESPLTELGIQQAKELGERLKGVQFDAIFSSDLGRAKHTAELAKLDREMAVLTTEMIRERNFGSLEGVSIEKHREEARELIEEYEKLSEEEKFNTSLADMETMEAATSRLIRFLRETAVAYPGKTILVVVHGTIIRGLLIKIEGMALRNYPSGSGTVANGAHLKVLCNGVDFQLQETFGINKVE